MLSGPLLYGGIGAAIGYAMPEQVLGLLVPSKTGTSTDDVFWEGRTCQGHWQCPIFNWISKDGEVKPQDREGRARIASAAVVASVAIGGFYLARML